VVEMNNIIRIGMNMKNIIKIMIAGIMLLAVNVYAGTRTETDNVTYSNATPKVSWYATGNTNVLVTLSNGMFYINYYTNNSLLATYTFSSNGVFTVPNVSASNLTLACILSNGNSAAGQTLTNIGTVATTNLNLNGQAVGSLAAITNDMSNGWIIVGSVGGGTTNFYCQSPNQIIPYTITFDTNVNLACSNGTYQSLICTNQTVIHPPASRNTNAHEWVILDLNAGTNSITLDTNNATYTTNYVIGIGASSIFIRTNGTTTLMIDGPAYDVINWRYWSL
jgi:hypothetical protein